MDLKTELREDMNAAANNQVSPNIQEDKITRAIENQTAKIPSVGYLTLAMGAMGVSAVLSLFFNKRPLANFFGLWVPSILIMGLYNKVVKIESELMRSQMH
jgi:hypothetical protein